MIKPRVRDFSTALLYAAGSVTLIAAAISIIRYFLTEEFPTHSDVFWKGVQCGMLGTLSLIFLAFGLLQLYYITARLLKQQ